MAKKIGIAGWILNLLIALALISIATQSLFNFSIIVWLSFGVKWIEYILAVIVGVFGLIGLGNLIAKTLK